MSTSASGVKRACAFSLYFLFPPLSLPSGISRPRMYHLTKISYRRPVSAIETHRLVSPIFTFADAQAGSKSRGFGSALGSAANPQISTGQRSFPDPAGESGPPPLRESLPRASRDVDPSVVAHLPHSSDSTAASIRINVREALSTPDSVQLGSGCI